LKATTSAPYIVILLLSAAPSRLRHAIVARCDAIIGGLIDLVIRGLQAVGPSPKKGRQIRRAAPHGLGSPHALGSCGRQPRCSSRAPGHRRQIRPHLCLAGAPPVRL